jgi:hypothetical protein
MTLSKSSLIAILVSVFGGLLVCCLAAAYFYSLWRREREGEISETKMVDRGLSTVEPQAVDDATRRQQLTALAMAQWRADAAARWERQHQQGSFAPGAPVDTSPWSLTADNWSPYAHDTVVVRQ